MDKSHDFPNYINTIGNKNSFGCEIRNYIKIYKKIVKCLKKKLL